MSHVYMTDYGLIPHSLRTDLPILIYIDDFIYSRSPYLKCIDDKGSKEFPLIRDFIYTRNKSINSIYGLRGRKTKTGNYKLKKERGEFLFKKEDFGEFFKYHEIKSEGGRLIGDLETLNKYILSEELLVINLKGFIMHLEVISYNKETRAFEFKKVPEYLSLLYKNREINYLMQIVEITINEIEGVLN